MRHLHTVVVSLCLAPLIFTRGVPAAHAELTEAELRYELGRDLSILGRNLPTWLGRHLPAIMSPASGGSGSAIAEAAGRVKIAAAGRIALFNNLDDLGTDLEVLEFPSSLPSVLPWPQLGLTLGVGLGVGMELDADVQFVPPVKIGDDELRLQASMFSSALNLRWRLNEPCGFRPAVIFGLGASYLQGRFIITSSFLEFYDDVAFDRAITGRVRLATFSEVDWTVVQATPEIRLAWCLGFFRPYLGFGVGISYGDIVDRMQLRAVATLDTVDGYAAYEDPIVEQARIVVLRANPARLTLRPFVGFDLDFDVFALTVQVDLAISGNSGFTGGFGDAIESFDVFESDFLHLDAAREAKSHASLLGTVALRTSF